MEFLPDQPEMLNLYLRNNFELENLTWMLKKMKELKLIRFVENNDNLQLITSQLKDSACDKKENLLHLLEYTTFVTSSKVFEKELKFYGKHNALTMEKNIEEPSCSWKLRVLTSIIEQGLKIGTIVTLPPEISLHNFPHTEKGITTVIGAGKLEGQVHPRLDYLALDGTRRETLEVLSSIDIKINKTCDDYNVFATAFGNQRHDALWSWF